MKSPGAVEIRLIGPREKVEPLVAALREAGEVVSESEPLPCFQKNPQTGRRDGPPTGDVRVYMEIK